MTVHDGGGRSGVTPHPFAVGFAQSSMDFLPQSAPAPEREILVTHQPRRQVVRHQRPGTASTSDVENAVKNLAIRILARSPIASIGTIDGREIGFQPFPLGSRQVGRIVLSFHETDSTPTLQGLFLNALNARDHKSDLRKWLYNTEKDKNYGTRSIQSRT